MPKQSQPGAPAKRKPSQQIELTPAEALSMLSSAATYCAQARIGIEVLRLPDGRVALALAETEVEVKDGRVVFTVTAAAS